MYAHNGIIKKRSIELDVAADSKEEAIDKLVSLMDAGGRLNDKAGYKEGSWPGKPLAVLQSAKGLPSPMQRWKR